MRDVQSRQTWLLLCRPTSWRTHSRGESAHSLITTQPQPASQSILARQSCAQDVFRVKMFSMKLTPDERAVLARVASEGGKARAKRLTPERRRAIALIATRAAQQ